ncbi:MAG: type II toxin-antitoxin system PemK/MazF family toxin [bacterium]
MINPQNLIRGSVWFVNLDPVIGHEQAKKRPCVILSANTYNQNRAGLAIIAPITSQPHEIYWRIPMALSEGGLEKKSFIICDQIRTVSILRFSSKMLGIVSDYTLERIEERLKILFCLVPRE